MASEPRNTFDNIATGLLAANRGGIKALAVTGEARSPLAPTLPTIAESGVPGFSATTWLGLLAPAGTPEPIVEYLNSEVIAILKSDSLQGWLDANGFTSKPTSGAGFRQFIRDETARFAELIKRNDIKVH